MNLLLYTPCTLIISYNLWHILFPYKIVMGTKTTKTVVNVDPHQHTYGKEYTFKIWIEGEPYNLHAEIRSNLTYSFSCLI